MASSLPMELSLATDFQKRTQRRPNLALPPTPTLYSTPSRNACKPNTAPTPNNSPPKSSPTKQKKQKTKPPNFNSPPARRGSVGQPRRKRSLTSKNKIETPKAKTKKAAVSNETAAFLPPERMFPSVQTYAVRFSVLEPFASAACAAASLAIGTRYGEQLT